MSGRKQHFIPQSLLRGFGFTKGNRIYVVAYTYDRGIFTPGTDGIGAEREFYSELDVEGTDETLDDKITDYEQPFPEVLNELRSLGEGKIADTKMTAEFVTHLIIRNDHFRKAITSGTGHLVEELTEAFTDEGQAKALLGLDRQNPSDAFTTEFAKLWAQFGPELARMGLTEAQFHSWAFGTVKDGFPAFFAETVGPLKEMFGGMVQELPELAANAQRRGLAEGMSPPKRVEVLSKFEWKVAHPATVVVLPDCVAVAVDANGDAYPLMLAEIEKVETIYMPLSSERLLVGTRGDVVEPNDGLTQAFAACSWDFFVARDRTPELESCQTLLRTRVSQFLKGTVEEVIEEAKAEQEE
jgi:hypothetical protein